jgi:hypothetical protein
MTRTESVPSSPARRLIGGLGGVVALIAVVGRLLAGSVELRGHPGAWWAGLAMTAVVLSRLLLGALDVAARRIPWTRLLLPALIAIELGLYVLGRTSRGAMMKLLALVEVVLVIAAVAAVFLRRDGAPAGSAWEERVERTLSGFVPAALARLIAIEMVIIGAALSAPFRRARPPRADEFGYFQSSPLRFMPWLILLAMPADVLLVRALVPARHVVWRFIFDASAVYALLWVIGVGVTMRRRPHRVGVDLVELRRGVLRRVRLSPRVIDEVALLPPLSGMSALRKLGCSGWLAAKGMPLVELRLREPVRIERVVGAAGAPTRRLLVAADDAEGFRRAIAQVMRQSDAA